ncbi:MAG TPA: SBBP repeat-containing protein [Candidatus Dormibacteraeota bacterium]|nr:SBBP repeat-containing protein [Candidatus Dormibacteraeota bacterium]
MEHTRDILAKCVAVLAAVAILIPCSGHAAGAQQHIWSEGFGGFGATDTVSANAIRADDRGGFVMGGSFQGTTDFGLGAMRASGADAFVGNFSSADGSCQWVVQIGGQGAATSVNSVAIDRVGDVYAAGVFTSTIHLSGAALTSSGGTDVFLAKYDGANGDLIWYMKMGGTGQDQPYAVAVDSNDDVVVTGYFTGSASFGGAPLTSAGSTDVFLAKYASNDGRFIWSKGVGGSGSDIGTGVAPGINGGIVVTGTFSSTVNFGGRTVQSAGGTDVFLVTYNGNGEHVWTRVAGGTSDDVANAVDTDADGNPVFTGYFLNTVDFGGGPVSSSAPSIFLVKYNATDGAHVWSRSFRSPNLAIFGGSGRAVSIHRDGSVALTGSIIDDVDFGGGALSGPYTADIFLAEFSPVGQHRWSRRFPATYRDEGEGIVFDPAGNLAVAGVFARAVDLGGGLISTGASNNAFLAKFASTVSQINPPTATAVPPTQSATPTFTPIPGTPTPTRTPTKTNTPGTQTGSVAGAITYYSNSQVVSGVEVDLIGPSNVTLQTNNQGQYSATVPQASWSIVPTKSGGFGSAVSSLDAARVLQALAGLYRFTNQQRVACDATGDGRLSTLDAVHILQFSAGMIDHLPAAAMCGSDWIFYPSPAAAQNQLVIYPSLNAGACQPGSIVLNPLVGSATGQDFDGILLGDCTGNWTAGMALRQRANGGAIVHAGAARRTRDGFVVPIYVKSSTPFQAMDLRLSYDAQSTFVGTTVWGDASAAIVSSQAEGGRLSMSLASAQSIVGSDGSIVLLRFRGAAPSLTLEGAVVDEEPARVLTHRRAG